MPFSAELKKKVSFLHRDIPAVARKHGKIKPKTKRQLRIMGYRTEQKKQFKTLKCHNIVQRRPSLAVLGRVLRGRGL